MAAFRLLRLLEYRFDGPDTMQTNMAHFAVGANAIRDFGRTTIRSGILVPELVDSFNDQGAECVLAESLRDHLTFEAFKSLDDESIAGIIVDSLREKGFEIVPRLVS